MRALFLLLLMLATTCSAASSLAIAQSESNGDDNMVEDSLTVATSYSPKKGEPHVDFILPSVEDPGELIQLSGYRGKKVLILHFASW